MSSRARFMTVAAAVLAVIFLFVVVMPALQRGGPGELLFVAGAFAAILLFERFLRSR